MKQEKMIRVLVADDSALMRNVIAKLLAQAGDIELVGAARDGEDAVKKAIELRPDVVTMDINMPRLDGMTAMQMILTERICPVIMFSSLTREGATETFECLHLGAFDFVAKPDGTVSADLDQVAHELIAKIRAAAGSGGIKRQRPRAFPPSGARPAVSRPARLAGAKGEGQSEDQVAIAIGISTGGPATISTVLPLLPADLPAAIFLVQHMPPAFIGAYVARLQRECLIEVVEAKSGDEVRPGVCYVAGNALHLCPFRKRAGEVVLRTPAHPKTLFVPGVDIMMEAVLAVYGRKTVGVLMTGIGDDGADQMVRIRQAGGVTIAESEETSVVYGMPYQALKRGGAEFVLPNWQIADKLISIVKPKALSGFSRRVRA